MTEQVTQLVNRVVWWGDHALPQTGQVVNVSGNGKDAFVLVATHNGKPVYQIVETKRLRLQP